MNAVDDDWRACTGKCSTDSNPLLFKTGQPLFCIKCGALTRLANGWKPVLQFGDIRHGTENGYLHFGCRCSYCVLAHNEKRRAENKVSTRNERHQTETKDEQDKLDVAWLARTRSGFLRVYGTSDVNETGEVFNIDY